MSILSNTGRVNVKLNQVASATPKVLSNIGRIAVQLNQISAITPKTRTGSNVPVGLYFSYVGHTLLITKGFVTVDGIKYVIDADWTKDSTANWSKGTGGGLLLSSIDESFTGELTIYAIGDGTKTDIAASLDFDPTLPAGYTSYAKLGLISFENGAIVEVYPTKDLANTFIDGDYQSEFDRIDSNILTLDTELTSVSYDVDMLKRSYGYTHEQGVSSNIWTITHNLNKRPSVTVVDSGDTVVMGLVTYLDENSLQIQFNSAFKGKAYLN